MTSSLLRIGLLPHCLMCIAMIGVGQAADNLSVTLVDGISGQVMPNVPILVPDSKQIITTDSNGIAELVGPKPSADGKIRAWCTPQGYAPCFGEADDQPGGTSAIFLTAVPPAFTAAASAAGGSITWTENDLGSGIEPWRYGLPDSFHYTVTVQTGALAENAKVMLTPYPAYSVAGKHGFHGIPFAAFYLEVVSQATGRRLDLGAAVTIEFPATNIGGFGNCDAQHFDLWEMDYTGLYSLGSHTVRSLDGNDVMVTADLASANRPIAMYYTGEPAFSWCGFDSQWPPPTPAPT